MLLHELKCLGDQLPHVVLVLLRVVDLVPDVFYRLDVSLWCLHLLFFDRIRFITGRIYR